MKKQRHDDPKEDSFFGTSFIIYLVLAAIGMLFLGAMGAYLYNRVLFDIPSIQIPGIFYVSTVVAIIISILCSRTVRAFNNNNFNSVITYWAVIIIGVLVFMVLQIYGWYTLIDEGLPASQNNSMGYLYVLSALHLFHILVGLPFHILILWKQYTAYQTDDFEKIEYIAQRRNKEHLILMSRYWHFLDGLWVVLMVFFLLNSM